MAEGRPTPPPRGASKFIVIAGIIVALMIVTMFVGLNMQHAQDTRAQQSGQVKPSEVPIHEKDLGKAPVQPK
ncbi:hypothetical protein RPMA_08375 [Tardiphaga alba]|uniref:Ti type entry exclusion protein TrbK n=1 Tax=Tardiphaga alba TaxID=340268 RepID=A0ABX8A576_9BRAD|nr:hypothetical protein [Tardiphaga alba]QUS38844.1 hypothetical protein RPMA_08375 [Tardiphaga alba]